MGKKFGTCGHFQDWASKNGLRITSRNYYTALKLYNNNNK